MNCIERHNSAFAVEFVPKDGKVQGFPLSHLLHYSLEPNPDLERSADAPPERLCISFPTHQVTVIGRRLEHLRFHLQSGHGFTVKVSDSRYANLKPSEPFVEEIVITPTPL